MEKKTILIGAGILVLFAILGIVMYTWMFTGIYDKPAFGVKDYYDVEGQKITGGEQAMIGGIPGIKYVTFQINALNEDTTSLEVEIVDATPTELKDKLPIGTKKIIEADATGSWISGLVDISELVGTDQTFTVTVLATSPLRQDATRTSELILTIEEDPEAGFSVDLTQGDNSENPGLDPDEGVNPDASINFRTTDLSYGSGSAVAYSASCGSQLTQYGYGSVVSSTGYNCDHTSAMVGEGTKCGANPVKVIPAVIGSIPGYAGDVSVWQGSDSTKICVCQTDDDGSGYKFAYYLSTDADATKVSNSVESVAEGMEAQC